MIASFVRWLFPAVIDEERAQAMRDGIQCGRMLGQAEMLQELLRRQATQQIPGPTVVMPALKWTIN